MKFCVMESAYDRAARQFQPCHRAPQRSAHGLGTDLSWDAAIQRFEFCFELAWKVIQERVRTEGLDCQSPKGCLKLAYKNGWLGDEAGWLAMLEDRNRTAHTYDEALAKEVYRRLSAHLPLLQALDEYLRSTRT